VRAAAAGPAPLARPRIGPCLGLYSTHMLYVYLSIHSLPTYIHYFAREGIIRASCCGVASYARRPMHPTRPWALPPWYAYVVYLSICLRIVYPHTYVTLHGLVRVATRGLLRSQAHAPDPVSMVRICYMSIYISIHSTHRYIIVHVRT